MHLNSVQQALADWCAHIHTCALHVHTGDIHIHGVGLPAGGRVGTRHVKLHLCRKGGKYHYTHLAEEKTEALRCRTIPQRCTANKLQSL